MNINRFCMLTRNCYIVFLSFSFCMRVSCSQTGPELTRWMTKNFKSPCLYFLSARIRSIHHHDYLQSCLPSSVNRSSDPDNAMLEAAFVHTESNTCPYWGREGIKPQSSGPQIKSTWDHRGHGIPNTRMDIVQYRLHRDVPVPLPNLPMRP